MIKTDLEFCLNELNEVLNLFDGCENIDIRHIFTQKEDRLINTIVLGGKSYAYGNLVKPFKDKIEEKRLVKRFAKLSLYKALSAYTGKSLPWGALTGIRPTKLAYSQLESEGEFKDFFISTMKVSEEKTNLIARILENQKGLYKKDDDNSDFFVFVPFCPSRCRYCSFISSDIKSAKKYVDLYVDTLVKEINQSKTHIKNLRSIYVGGGTPVSLSNENLDKILSAMDDINNGVEFTVEAGRPDVISEETLSLLLKHKVTRICINPQTFNDKTLEKIGRNHTAKDVIDKFNLAKGKFSINMDLIAGLDGETFEDFKYSLDKAISLSPDGITVHTLAVKRGSYLAEEERRLNVEEIDKMVDYAHKTLQDSGYNPYYLYRQKYMAGCLENTGYAKAGKECLYNINAMEEISSTVACGANAISKVVTKLGEKIERYASPKDVKTYIEKIDTILKEKERLFS